MPKNEDVKIATELYEKLPEHEKKLAAALINATAAQLPYQWHTAIRLRTRQRSKTQGKRGT